MTAENRSRRWRQIKRRTVWAIENRLLSWMVDAEPSDPSPGVRLLAEDPAGDVLMPSRTREDWWQGYWCWWKPTHWPAYLRSRRLRTYVMVEFGDDDA